MRAAQYPHFIHTPTPHKTVPKQRLIMIRSVARTTHLIFLPLKKCDGRGRPIGVHTYLAFQRGPMDFADTSF